MKSDGSKTGETDLYPSFQPQTHFEVGYIPWGISFFGVCTASIPPRLWSLDASYSKSSERVSTLVMRPLILHPFT